MNGMDGSEAEPADRGWTSQTTRLAAAWRGARETPVLPPAILFCSFVGFGALTSETGFTLLDTLFMSALIFALPGQVVLVDEMARGASVLTAALAVTATGIRLLPMTVALLPTIRDRRGPKWMEWAVAYFVAVTMYLETMRRAPGVPRALRAAYTLGIALVLVFSSSAGALIGFILARQVPDVVAAGLLFMTPLYFLLGMLMTAKSADSLFPIGLGLVLGPLLHLWFPDFDLLLTGAIGGTLGFLMAHFARSRRGRS